MFQVLLRRLVATAPHYRNLATRHVPYVTDIENFRCYCYFIAKPHEWWIGHFEVYSGMVLQCDDIQSS